MAPGLILFQISMVNIVLELLNTEVRELISAAIMAASIKPFRPVTHSIHNVQNCRESKYNLRVVPMVRVGLLQSLMVCPFPYMAI